MLRQWGVDEVAHTYMGMPATSMTSMERNGLFWVHVLIPEGKKNVMRPGNDHPDGERFGNIGEKVSKGKVQSFCQAL